MTKPLIYLFSSTLNKRLISKILGLKITFLQELDLIVTNNCNHLTLKYNYFDAYQTINNHHIEYVLSYLSPKKSNTHDNFKEITNWQRSEFMFLTFDNNLLQVLSGDVNQESSDDIELESITIFDDPFNALAFYQQTNLPTVVFKFPSSNNVDKLDLQHFCGKIDKRFKKVFYIYFIVTIFICLFFYRYFIGQTMFIFAENLAKLALNILIVASCIA